MTRSNRPLVSRYDTRSQFSALINVIGSGWKSSFGRVLFLLLSTYFGRVEFPIFPLFLAFISFSVSISGYNFVAVFLPLACIETCTAITIYG